jgi:multidrug efflux pump subunit AcrB
MFSSFFIDRPIFSVVISLVIAIAGAVAMLVLPIAQYPQITPIQIQVTATYPGANADLVAQNVAAPIEQQVNGANNMIYMSSTSSSTGNYTLTVTTRPPGNIAHRRGPSGWRPRGCSRGMPWSEGSWRCGSRPRRTDGCGSSRRPSV